MRDFHATQNSSLFFARNVTHVILLKQNVTLDPFIRTKKRLFSKRLS